MGASLVAACCMGHSGQGSISGSLSLCPSLSCHPSPRYNKPTVSLKGAVLYWHFVDIVWIAVYGIIYAAQL